MGRLDGKVALITGGAQGMGVSHARVFAKEGAKVIITDIDEEKGEKVAKELGDSVVFFKHDVTSAKEWEDVVKKAEEKFGHITVLVNNAGIVITEPIMEVTQENFDKNYQVNQLGVFLGMQKVFPSMQKAKGGSIINISSVSGLAGQEYSISYTATKFAVTGMTKSAAAEFGKDGIRVNSVHPGAISTPMALKDEYQEGLRQWEEAAALGRIAEPEEVSNLCLYLASDDSSFSTGSEFVVDGGIVNITKSPLAD